MRKSKRKRIIIAGLFIAAIGLVGVVGCMLRFDYPVQTNFIELAILSVAAAMTAFGLFMAISPRTIV